MTNQLDHCLTNEQLRQLAADAGQFNLNDIEQHLDECPDCRSRMGAIEQDAEWCEEILPVLRDAETIQELNASGTGHDLDAQTAIRLLGPTDEPQYLGRIGTYEVTGVVGSGGMGIVYKTFDRSLDRFVAIKMMHPHLATSGAARQRFAREAKAAAAVIDDHVLPIYSVDQWQNVPYLVMQYSSGTTLEKRVATQGPLDIPEVLRIAMQTAHGLAAAHAQGLVHRDVKPSNILLDGTVERALLTDFGLARAVDDGSMTRTGMIAGTPQYMSPEQAHGDQLDHRSDLFSLGSVMYFMLTGRSPFRAETTMGVLNRIGHDAPRSLRSINPQVPIWLEDIVMRLLEKNRDQRYQSAQEVAELLGKWLAHLQQPENVSPPSPLAVTSPRDERFQLPTGWKRYLWGGLAIPFVLFAAVLLYIETGKGTLKIENNASAAVPIRILKNNKTVKELTVSAEGATTRLHAGEYVIEIEGDTTEYKLAGNQVTLSRGGDWFARIELTPLNGESVAASNQSDPSNMTEATEDGSSTLTDTSNWPHFEKTNVADLRRNPNSHPDLDCLIRVDFDSAEGIDWLFSDSPFRREPIGPFCVDNISGAANVPLVDAKNHRIRMSVRLECGEIEEGIWMCLEGRRIAVNVTQEDFDYVQKGNALTKVVYLTRGNNDEETGVLETVVSSRLDPGVDPLEEADRRGFPLVSATFQPMNEDAAGIPQPNLPPEAPVHSLKLPVDEESRQNGFAGDAPTITALDVSPDGNWLACATMTEPDFGSILLYDCRSGLPKDTPVASVSVGQPTDLAFSPDGTMLACASLDKGLLCFEITPDVTEGPWLRRLFQTQESDTSPYALQFTVAWSPDGKRLVTSSEWQLFVWNTAQFKLPGWEPEPSRELPFEEDMLVLKTVWSPDGKNLAVGADNGKVYLWDFSKPSPAMTVVPLPPRPDELILSLSWSPDSTRLAIGRENWVYGFHVDRQLFMTHEFPGGAEQIRMVAYSADGTVLASADAVEADDPTIHIFPDELPGNTARIVPIAEPINIRQSNGGHTKAISALKFSPDGHYLLSGGRDGEVKWWIPYQKPRQLDPIHADALRLGQSRTTVSASFSNAKSVVESLHLEQLGRYRTKVGTDAPIRVTGKQGEVIIRRGDTTLVELPRPVLEFSWNHDGFKPDGGLADFEAFNFVLFEWKSDGSLTATAYRSPIHRSLTTGDVEWKQAQTLMNQLLLKQQLANLDRIKELKLTELGRKEAELRSDGPVYLSGTETIIRRGEAMLIALSAPTRTVGWSQEGIGNHRTFEYAAKFDYILCEWRLDGKFIAKAYKSPAIGNNPFVNQGLTASTINENGVRDTLKAFARAQAEYTHCVIQYRVWVTKPTRQEEAVLDSLGFAHSAQEFTCRYTFDGQQVSDKIIGYTVKGQPAEISAWLGRNSVDAPDSPFASIFPLGHSPQSPLHPEELQKNADQMKYEQDMSNPRIKWTPRLYWTTKRDGAHVQMQLGFDGQQKRWVPSLVRSRMIHPDTPDEGMAVESRVEKWDIDSQGIPRMVSGTSRWIVTKDGKDSEVTWHWHIDSAEFGATTEEDEAQQ